ncbi:DUF58 domain-containing protein [Flammeovirga pacifica]|uniref:VWFA domain-containing protein n=1 Tax=Flammeovirga pacifica TaxID=915059 RepID=A0A1S1Z1I2_FLAPC|nr:DUF58 domain-containing protein [Flammeovirga pacifica]OHX67128.1 hypothetical protein NH26_12630 [Flammeovirga pacifica]
MKELLKKLRKYEIRIRKAINSHMQGDFHSVFKGSGLEFDDVRLYQYGDDIRHIDWNVSAKGHGTFVKTFKEEKEQNVFFVVDVSASQDIGKPTRKKIDVTKEIASVLAMSALKEASSVGLLCFSDDKERYVKPNKGNKHAYQLIGELFRLKPKSPKTNINKALGQTLSMIKRKSIIIVISDFVDENYERHLKALCRKHDLVVIHVGDDRETSFPRIGIAPLFDKEAGKTIWVNTSSKQFREKLDKFYAQNRLELSDLVRRNGGNYTFINAQEDYVPKLVQLFKVRNSGRK